MSLFSFSAFSLGRIGEGAGFGPFSNLGASGDINEAAGGLVQILSKVLGVITLCAGLWFFFKLVTGAFSYISAEGDKGKVEQAQQKITSAIIGLTLVVIAYALTGIIGRILGLDILNPQNIIPGLGPTAPVPEP